MLVEAGDGLGADILAAGGVHGGVGNVRVNHAQGGFHESAVLVDLGDDPVGVPAVVSGYGGPSPRVGLTD